MCEAIQMSKWTLQVLEGVEPNEHGTWQVDLGFDPHKHR